VKDDRVYLLHIRDAIESIREFTADGEAAFLADKKTQFAVVRSLEIIGEAVKRISPELKAAHPVVPWRTIASMRNRADPQLLWRGPGDRLGSRSYGSP
jgi:uncharacterized protein with HEPN domain